MEDTIVKLVSTLGFPIVAFLILIACFVKFGVPFMQGVYNRQQAQIDSLQKEGIKDRARYDTRLQEYDTRLNKHFENEEKQIRK